MARTSSSSENILHFGLVRLRVNGNGFLRSFLRSLDDVRNVTLSPLTLNTLTDIEPTILSNFTNQRAQLELRTTSINETFQISKIIIFVKPVATSYPQ